MKSGFRFVALEPGQTAPQPPEPESTQRRRTTRLPSMPLESVCSFLSLRVRMPVVADEAVGQKRPSGDSIGVEIPRGGRPANVLKIVASLYDVGLKEEPVEVESYLVYHPKYASATEMGRWELDDTENP